jgi:hypothetical protein
MTRASFNIQSVYQPEEVAVLDAAYRQAVKVIGASVSLDARGKTEIARLVLVNFPLHRDASKLAATVIARSSWSSTLLSRILPMRPAAMNVPG